MDSVNNKDKSKQLKIFYAILGIVLGVIVALIPPPSGLTVKAMYGMGILVWAIVYWVFNVLPDYVTALMMCVLWVLFKVASFNLAFSQFSGETWWIVVGGFGIGYAVSSTGLMKRIALKVMRFFPNTRMGQVFGMLLSGIIISPTIPSINAKAAIAAPLSQSVSDNMGYKDHSPESAGLFVAMFMGFVASSPMFLSGTTCNYLAKGLMPKEFQSQFTWLHWAFCALPWSIVYLIGCYIAIKMIYRSKKKSVDNTVNTEINNSSDSVKKEEECGPMSREEKITGVVLIITMLLWMTERIHGISSTIVAIIALSVLITFGIIDKKSFKNGIAWNSLIFIGGLLNLSSVFPSLKIDKWMQHIISPIVVPLLHNPCLLIIVLCIFIYLMRFIIVSLVASISLLLLALMPLISNTGVNPFVIVLTVVTSIYVWNINYQNSGYVIAYGAVDGRMCSHSQAACGSVAFMIINIIALLACIPFWKIMGMLP
jgi:DASS family divalent anion:Na+ symporter